MAFYREHLLQLTEDMDTHFSHGIRCAIGQIRTSSHQLRIETGRYSGVPAEARTCPLCHMEAETELTMYAIAQFTMRYEVASIACLERALDPLSRVMGYEDQRCLGLFLLELRRHRDLNERRD